MGFKKFVEEVGKKSVADVGALSLRRVIVGEKVDNSTKNRFDIRFFVGIFYRKVFFMSFSRF